MVIYFHNINKPYICVFDIEHDNGKLVQFSGILFKQVGDGLYQVYKNINLYVKQKNISQFIQNFTNISQSFLDANGVEINDANKIFDSFIDVQKSDVLMVSHGVHQDCMILIDNGFNIKDCERLCSHNLAKKVLERNFNLSLGDLATECGCAISSLHNAYIDALATACVLSYLLKIKED